MGTCPICGFSCEVLYECPDCGAEMCEACWDTHECDEGDPDD